MAFNSKQYAWSNVEVVLFGQPVTAIRGVKYKASQEKEVIYGAGDRPIGIQAGNKSYEGEVTLLQSELEAIRKVAGKEGDIMDIPAFDIIITYKEQGNGALVQDVVKFAEFTEMEKSMSQGDKFMEITLPFIALDIQKGI